MSGLPRGWADTTLGAVIELKYGKSLPKGDRTDGPFNVYGSNGIVGTNESSLTSAPAIIVGRKGSFGEVNYSEEKCFPIDTTYYVDSFESVDPSFCYALLRYLPLKTLNRATAIPGLNRQDAYNLTFALPPLAEQERIVAKLDALNAKSARVRTELARIETLVSRYKQAVLSKAFGGELTQEWPTVSLDRLSETIFDGPFGSNLKTADYTSEGPRVVRLENIGTRVFIEEKRTHISEEKFRSLGRHLLQANDLLFSSFVSEQIRACLFPGNVDFQAINKADCFCVRFDAAKIDPQFALLQLTTEGTYRHFVQQVHGATRPRINLSQLKQYSILAPSLDVQQEVVRRIETAFAKIDRLAAEARRALELLGNLAEAVLAKAFRGELVAQDENDEPAEKLLERIRAERAAAPKEKTRTVRRKTTMLTARDFLHAKLQNWPEDGVSFQDLRREFSGDYDDLKEAIFASLSDEKSTLQQIFDEKTSIMTIRKRER